MRIAITKQGSMGLVSSAIAVIARHVIPARSYACITVLMNGQ